MMYRLTPRMIQNFRPRFERYHQLFSAGRCSGWELEELIFRSIQSDNIAQHTLSGVKLGHDDEADIRVRINGDVHLLQIKSGRIRAGNLTLSGFRLGRFAGDFHAINDYLNGIMPRLYQSPIARLMTTQEGDIFIGLSMPMLSI